MDCILDDLLKVVNFRRLEEDIEEMILKENFETRVYAGFPKFTKIAISKVLKLVMDEVPQMKSRRGRRGEIDIETYAFKDTLFIQSSAF